MPPSSGQHMSLMFGNVFFVSDFKSNHFFFTSAVERCYPETAFTESVISFHASVLLVALKPLETLLNIMPRLAFTCCSRVSISGFLKFFFRLVDHRCASFGHSPTFLACSPEVSCPYMGICEELSYAN